MKSKTNENADLATLKLICRALDDKKAEDLRVLDVSGQSSITDYMVLATGTSEPHLRALRIELEKVLDAAKTRIVGIDTNQESGWMVVDAFDVMVHIFTREKRDIYGLENLWKDAAELSVGRILDEKKPAPAPKAPKAPKARKAVAKKPAVKKAAPKKAAKPAAKKAPAKAAKKTSKKA